MSSADYGPVSRLLHRVALGSPAMLRATMQMEQSRLPGSALGGDGLNPVFICGLARSGSTLLLNRLAATGAFSTSTYRHMPFVLAPGLWSGKSRTHRKRAIRVERAHGDGMEHGFDSEEAFEEVFWRAVTPPADRNRPLLPWNAPVDDDTAAEFSRFMQSVVCAGDAGRYLSKNNNNVSRLPFLLDRLPTARIVIPFRNPLSFAGSTLAQHRRFLDNYARNPFDARYMAWLGHHEFGPLFKPFAAPGVEPPGDVTSDYLCRYWTAVYRRVAEIDDARVLFFDYDAFCDSPERWMGKLGAHLGLDTAPTPPAEVHPARHHADGAVADETRTAAEAVHQRLRARA